MTRDAPDLYLDWEGRLVGWLFRRFRKFKPLEVGPDVNVAAMLGEHEFQLHLLAQLFAGGSVRLGVAEAAGGVRGQTLLLPAHLDVAPNPETNLELYRLRVVIDGTRIKRGVSEPSGDPWLDEIQAIADAGAAIAWLREGFEGFSERLQTLQVKLGSWAMDPGATDAGIREQALWVLRKRAMQGLPMGEPSDRARALRQLDEPSVGPCAFPLWGGALGPADSALADIIDAEEAATTKAVQITTELEAPPKDHIERAVLAEDEDAEVMPMHTFEKVECLDSFNGNMSRTDGSDELEDHSDALEEVDLRHVVRGGDPAESVFRAELDGLSPIPDVHQVAPGERGILYDEWHQSAGAYKRNWTTVYPSVARPGDQVWAKHRLKELSGLRKKLLARLEAERQARQWVGRQLDGEDIDLEALVETYGDRRAGHSGDGRLFHRNPRRRRDSATTVLLDISLSSDSWVDNRRVLDVSRDSILLLGEVAEALGDRFEILAFASNTRNHCRVWRVKGWEDSWLVGRARLGALTPTGYTRIGPALRHASVALKRQPAENKLLLLMTDGKPNDYDRYEGSHGIADVRQVTRECARDGIRVHGIGIDASAAHTLPLMFGTGGSQLLRNLGELPETLVEAFGKAT